MTKIAEMAHAGIARAIRPSHTPFDGDALFAISTGAANASANLASVGALAAEAVSEAILRAVMKATALGGFQSYSEISR
jgi:L-aminopeptidase/D-esterase-like protein